MDGEDDPTAIIKELKKEMKELKEIQGIFAYGQAEDRARIKDLETYLEIKNNGGRRDFDLLTIKLKTEVLSRRTGMDYKDILNFFHFKSHEEAFRLMNKTVGNFPLELKLHKNKTGRGGRKRIVRK